MRRGLLWASGFSPVTHPLGSQKYTSRDSSTAQTHTDICKQCVLMHLIARYTHINTQEIWRFLYEAITVIIKKQIY